MNKMIGIMTAWGAEMFMEASIKQALYMCDEVLLCVAPHSEAMRKFEDKTMDIAKKYKDKIKLIDVKTEEYCSLTKANAMNNMIDASELWDVGNWLCLLDVDEFWFKKDIDIIKNTLQTTKQDWIWCECKYFYINTNYYMKNDEGWFWKIKEIGNRFVKSNQWSKDRGESGKFPEEVNSYHYSALLNPYAKKEFWRTDWLQPQPVLIDWVDKIYLNYDLNNQDYWVRENEKLFGSRQPFARGDYRPKPDGTLFKHEDKHPEWIEELGITEIQDFRKLYRSV